MAKQKDPDVVDLAVAPPEPKRSRVAEILGAAREIGGEVWDAGKPMFDHGRSEVSALLNTGSAYVMYQHGEKDQGVTPADGHAPEAAKSVEIENGMELDR